MAGLNVEWEVLKSSYNALCTGMKQAKNALCSQFYAKKLLSDSINSKCSDKSTDLENFMKEMMNALVERVANDKNAYYTIKEVLEDTQGVQYLAEMLEKKRTGILEKLLAEHPDKERKSEWEKGTPPRDPPEKKISSQEKYGNEDEQQRPLAQASFDSTSRERDAQVLLVLKGSSTSINSSALVNGNEIEVFRGEAEGMSLSIKSSMMLGKPDDKQPDQGDSKVGGHAGDEFQDICPREMKVTESRVTSTTKYHRRSNSLSSSPSDSSDTYESVVSSPSKSKITTKKERVKLPYCCRKQVQKVEKTFSTRIQNSQQLEIQYQESVEELRILKIKLETSERQKAELQDRIADYQKEKFIFQDIIKEMEIKLENEKAIVQLLEKELGTEEAERNEERNDNRRVRDKLEKEVDNERAKTEKLQKEKENERKLKRKYKVEALRANRQQHPDQTLPTQDDIYAEQPEIQCREQESDFTRKSGSYNYRTEPPTSHLTRNFIGEKVYENCLSSGPIPNGARPTSQEQQGPQDERPYKEQNKLGQTSKLV